MDLSNSSWMTTNGRFRQVSWKADERVKPPHPLSSEPPPDQEPQCSCAHPPPGPQRWAQAHDTHSRAREMAAHTPHNQRCQGFRKASRAGMGPGPQGRRQPRQVLGQYSPREDQPPACTQAPRGQRHVPHGSTLPWTRPRAATNPLSSVLGQTACSLKASTGLPTETVTQRVTNIPHRPASEAKLPPVPRAPAPGPPRGRVQAPRPAGWAPTCAAGPSAPRAPEPTSQAGGPAASLVLRMGLDSEPGAHRNLALQILSPERPRLALYPQSRL